MARLITVAVVLGFASVGSAQFPLPIPTRPTSFPLKRPQNVDGTVLAWGDNYFGQASVPPGLSGVVQVAAGSAHSLALKSDGTVLAWGDNYFGKASVPPDLSGVVQVAAGAGYSLALISDGTLLGWGYTTTPGSSGGIWRSGSELDLSRVVQVAAGPDRWVALTSDGTVFSSDRRQGGSLRLPIPFEPLYRGAVQVAAGQDHSLALMSDGTVVAWLASGGLNDYGQASVPAGLSGVVQVAAGFNYSLALKSDGTVVAWGRNYLDQLKVPAGLSGVVEVAAGSGWSLALKSDGTLVSWGRRGDLGELGVPEGLSGVVQVDLSEYSDVSRQHSLVLQDLRDSDGDGLYDAAESKWHKTDPTKVDTDDDGLSDGVEISIWTNPTRADTDGDGLNDGVEVNPHGTDPKRADTDGDDMPDGWEVANGLNAKDSGDAGTDIDSDGLTNREEHASGTDLRKADTDGDGLEDGLEVKTHGTDPKEMDTDGDGLEDGLEVKMHKTDPTNVDTDDDGLSDGAEIITHKTDPTKADTDDDGYSDNFEILFLKSNPLRPNDTPALVTVGDPRNPDEDGAGQDVENAGIGYVGEVFSIATTEVTNLMYARFLNAVAKEDFLYGLYTTPMGTDASGGIVRDGSSGNYNYAVKPGFENRPVNFVSIYDALRYINWLHNGMPSTSAQDSSTTENGAYKLLGANPRNVIRNAGAKFFLPDQDEWHKAAFFDPNPGQGRPTDSYWPFADQSTTGPGGNFGTSRINMAAMSAGPSHYGTYDQGGNVWEWTETVLNDGKRLISVGSRPMTPAVTTRETADLGFRVAKALPIATGDPLVVPALTRVGEEFNLGDDTNGRIGAVAYEFNMGSYEVSNAQYSAFLNAVAKTDSFYGLYSTRMGTDPQGGIMRSGQNGNFVYSVKPGFANKPVNFVTVYSAMRFCNWLHNGARVDSETERGAYRLLGNIPSDTSVLRRSPSARFYLPTQDEWYKAAFYDPSPAGMPTASYWSYAVRTDLANAQQINFGGAYAGVIDVSLPGVASFFGTFGQSGNVAEWTESLSSSNLERLVWGGNYSSGAAGVSSGGKVEMDPLVQAASVGFRVAADKAFQRIAAFPSIGVKNLGVVPFNIAAPKATSGLPVRLTVKSGPAMVSGATVTVTGTGEVVLAANQDGDQDFDPAPEVTTSFSVIGPSSVTGPKKTHTITFKPAATQKFKKGRKFTLNATASPSKLPVSFRSSNAKILSISGRTATIRAKGKVTVTASQSGNANYLPARNVSRTITIR